MHFLHRSSWIAVGAAQEILWFTENLENHCKKHGFLPPELAARNSNPRRSPAHGEEPRQNPIENVGIPCVFRWPQPGNCVSLGMPLAPRAKSYGLRKTLEFIGKSMVFSLRSWQRITASIVFSRQGTHGRVCGQKNDTLAFCLGILGNLIARHVI